MTEGAFETPITLAAKQEQPTTLVQNNEVNRERFVQATTRDLILLRRSSRIVMTNKKLVDDPQERAEAEQMYKESCLELFFRLQGDLCREAYHKWPAIKQKKQKAWEEQMYAKYGEKWEQEVTDEDRSLLVYTPEELKAYATHKAIEEKALRLKKKEINELCRRENIRNPEKPVSYFKLVKARTLLEHPEFTEREVHKAVYSIDFLLFYMRQMYKEMIIGTFNALRGKEENIVVVMERYLLEAVEAVRKIVEMNRLRPQKNLFQVIVGA